MQEYFKYDKLQRGAPLFMKSDSDGSKDKENRGLALGVKTTPEGIKHFTNWDNISNSIDSNGGLRLDDAQNNSLKFSMRHRKYSSQHAVVFDLNTPDVASWKDPDFISGLGGAVSIAVPRARTDDVSFVDSWTANDIKIVDDIAFVSYEDYTDIHRKDIDLGTVKLLQPLEMQTSKQGYDYLVTEKYAFGSLVFRTSLLESNNFISPRITNVATGLDFADGEYDYPEANVRLPNSFASYDNTILKVKFSDRTLYFKYGGALANDTNSKGAVTKNLSGDAMRASKDVSGDSQYTDFNDGDYAGAFYIVTHEAVSEATGTLKVTERGSAVTHIQLSVANSSDLTDILGEGAIEFGRTLGGTTTFVYTNTGIDAEVTLTKIQPVRKCGKVDVYVRKTGIITAAVNNRFTSPGHNLETNDIIKITSALFDGTEEGALDLHPLNGEKFVKKVDDDTFDLYDDQFFEKHSSTSRLKTTDGINWTCVSTSNGQLGQSWDYYKTIFSPTGRNGYTSAEDGESAASPNSYGRTTAFNSNNFTTTNLSNKVFFGDDTLDDEQTTYAQGSVIDFSTSITTGATGGKEIQRLLNSVPVCTFGSSLLDKANKAPQDYYPFHAKSDEDFGIGYSAYHGSKFGCSLDAKFSHMSGSSKVYTIAIGERGSDVSVNIFGAVSEGSWRSGYIFDDDDEFNVDGGFPSAVEYTNHDTGRRKLNQIFREKVVPNYMPHGKVHVLSMTVDQYGRITDISHKNSLFGDGSCVGISDETSYAKSSYPWKTFLQSYRNRRNDGQAGNGSTFAGAGANLVDTPTTPFDEALQSQTTYYWDRAAITHWLAYPVYDYWGNSTNSSSNNTIRNIVPFRLFTDTEQSSGNNTSYFGNMLLGESSRSFKRINRFGEGLETSQWYICPWVDSFGKSVCLNDISVESELIVFGSATTRSNLKYYNTSLRPVFTDSNYALSTDEANSQIGQITAISLGKTTYNISQVLEINSGGSVDSSYFSKTSNKDTTTVSQIDSNDFIKLRTGNSAGFGCEEVVSSSYLSSNSIKYKNGYLFFADQILDDSKSVINIMQLNQDRNLFTKINAIEQPFSTIKTDDASLVGDGFGMDIRLGDRFLLTNCTRTTNDLGDDIGASIGLNAQSFRVDSLSVYSFNYSTAQYDFLQSITPTFNELDHERYPLKFTNQYSDNLLDINNVTYENDVLGSQSWNIKMLGRYDTVEDKILMKDPIEYVLFGVDNTVDNRSSAISNRQVLSDSTIEPYLYFTEHFEDDSVYYDYSAKDNFILKDSSKWEEFGSTSTQIRNIRNSIKTAVFFLDIPSLGIDRFGDISITIALDSNVAKKIDTIDLPTLAKTTVIDDSTNPVIPSLVLYKKDPRSMIVPNGPITDATNTSICPFTDGMFTYGSNEINVQGDYYNSAVAQPPLFRGGANDLFFYGSLVGTTPKIRNKRSFRWDNNTLTLDDNKDFLRHYYGGDKNLGELFDVSYNKAGNTNKGIISWAAPDVYDLYKDEATAIDPYAGLFSNVTLNNDGSYTFTIPYNSWKRYLIRGDFIKSSSDNRPFFDDFDRIKHGSLSSNNPFSGTWDKTYNDANRASYNPKKIIRTDGSIEDVLPTYTLALGFVITSVSDVNLSNNQIFSGSFVGTTGRDFRGIRSGIEAHSKYPYSKIISLSEFDSRYTGAKRTKVISHDIQSQINNIDFSILSGSIPAKKIKTQFHKIAYFEYNNQAYSDVQKSKIVASTNSVDRYAFGRFAFSPLPIGFAAGNSKNQIIRIGKSKASSDNAAGNRGTFSKSLQVVSSDSFYNQSTQGSLKTDFYLTNNDNKIHHNVSSTGNVIGYAELYGQNLLGGFDISSPEFLSLNMRGKAGRNDDITLFIRDTIVSGSPTMFASGVGSNSNSMNLFIGQKIAHTNPPNPTLFIKTPDIKNQMSLYTFETKPSGNLDMNIEAPYANEMTLSFKPATTGVATLQISGPLQSTGVQPLHTRGRATTFAQSTLHTSGIGLMSSGITTSISGVITKNNNMSLFMNRPQSGVSTLHTAGKLVPTGTMPLTIATSDAFNTGASLHIGTVFEPIAVGANLNIKPEFALDKKQTAFVKGNIGRANTLTNSQNDFIISRKNRAIDISNNPEDLVDITFNSSTTSTNSLVRRDIDKNYFENKTKSQFNTSSVFAARPVGDTAKNPALTTSEIDNGSSPTLAFYDDMKDDFSLNKIIKTNSFGSNGRNVIVCSVNNKLSQIDIYDIVNNQRLNFQSSIFGNFTKAVPTIEDSSSNVVIHTVTVGKGENDYGFGNKFYIDGEISPELTLIKGKTYRFDVSDISVANHPLRFSFTENGTHGGGTQYSHDFTAFGTPGTPGAYVEITMPDRSDIYYYCHHHSGMGNKINLVAGDNSSYDIYSDTVGGDSFIDIRLDLKNRFDSGFAVNDLIESDSDISINDAQISDSGFIAVSFRVKLRYNNAGLDLDATKIFNLITIFNMSDILNGRSGSKYVDDYSFYVMEESGSRQQKSSSGYNISFSDQDVYFDRRESQFGQVWKLSNSDDYSNATRVINFADTSDALNYINFPNSQYINEVNKRAAFGVPIKIFNDYYSDGKIMFVGAQLFDPFVLNTLSVPHTPNPIGAVYIYKQAVEETEWTYFGATYGKGYTSENISANLSEYSGSQISNKQYGLFGYDFDYRDGNLLVSEPGGNGNNELNVPRAYLFQIQNSITLLETYVASNISLPNSHTISAGDEFGSTVILLNANNPITFSHSIAGDGLIHSLKSNETFANSLAYTEALPHTTASQAQQNIANENNNYDPSVLSLVSSKAISRSSRVLEIKDLDFGNSIHKLGVARRFSTDVEFDLVEDFNLDKLSFFNLSQRAFSLFISGPVINNNNITTYASGIGAPSNEASLFVPVNDFPSGVMTLNIASPFATMPLHIERVNDNIIPAFISGSPAFFSNDTTLVMTGKPAGKFDTTLHVSGTDPRSAQATLNIDSRQNAHNVGVATMYIGQDTDHDKLMTLQVNAVGPLDPEFIPAASGMNLAASGTDYSYATQTASMFIAGPPSAQASGVTTLFTTTPIPPITPSGFFEGSGTLNTVVSGNNDGSVFSQSEAFAPLSISATIQNTGAMPLYMERPFANDVTLSIKNLNPTGTMSTFIEGAFIQSGVTTLTVAPPTNNVVTIITRGFLE